MKSVSGFGGVPGKAVPASVLTTPFVPITGAGVPPPPQAVIDAIDAGKIKHLQKFNYFTFIYIKV
jgi:hypothetical protein